MMVGNERFYGTLELRLTTPQGVMGGIPGKLVAPVGDGLLSGILVMITMVVLGDLRLSRSNAAALLLAVLLSVLGALAAGLVTAAVAIRTNDPFLTPNLLSLVFLLCGGYVADPARLPLRLGAVGAVLPGGHAVSIVMTMTRTGHVPAGPVLGALGVIAAWAVIGLGWLAAMTASARRHGTTAPS
jgi:ABC-type multidrug transport system permease subunit